MVAFTKFVYEERYRYFQFKRDDGEDGLSEGETLSSPSVTCLEKSAGADCSSTMISNISVVDDTMISYKIKAGESGKTYQLLFTAETSQGQKVKDMVEIAVK